MFQQGSSGRGTLIIASSIQKCFGRQSQHCSSALNLLKILQFQLKHFWLGSPLILNPVWCDWSPADFDRFCHGKTAMVSPPIRATARRFRRVRRRDDAGSTAATAMDTSRPKAPGGLSEISESDSARRVLAWVGVQVGWRTCEIFVDLSWLI